MLEMFGGNIETISGVHMPHFWDLRKVALILDEVIAVKY